MPEKIVRVLECDCKHDPPVEGKRYLIDDERQVTSVILCPEHAVPLLEFVRLGTRVVRSSGRRGHSPHGLSDQRLSGIIRENS